MVDAMQTVFRILQRRSPSVMTLPKKRYLTTLLVFLHVESKIGQNLLASIDHAHYWHGRQGPQTCITCIFHCDWCLGHFPHGKKFAVPLSTSHLQAGSDGKVPFDYLFGCRWSVPEYRSQPFSTCISQLVTGRTTWPEMEAPVLKGSL
jgi:hypothetical protein